MPDDSKTVGNDAKFEDITEMPIDVYLYIFFYYRIIISYAP